MKHNITLSLNKNRIVFGCVFILLWLCAITPKQFQFVIYLFCAILILLNNQVSIKKRLHLDTTSAFIGFGLVIQANAVLMQFFSKEEVTTSRLLASLNTLSLWVISLVFFSYFRYYQFEREYFKRVAKWLTFALVILLFICVVSKILPTSTITILGKQFVFKKVDYLESGRTLRFVGLMSSAVGIAHMFCICFPFVVLYISKWKSFFLKAIVCVVLYWPVLESNSRIGIVVGAAMLLCGIVYLMKNHYGKVNVLILSVIFLSITLLYAATHFSSLADELMDVFNSRGGSNLTRFMIYRESIKKTWNESPLIGIGIKYMIGNYPYGSHCTYIGLFYKSGLIGLALFLTGFISMIKDIIEVGKETRVFPIYLMCVLYFLLLILTDLDGNEWYIVLRFSTWGLILNSGIWTKLNENKEILT